MTKKCDDILFCSIKKKKKLIIKYDSENSFRNVTNKLSVKSFLNETIIFLMQFFKKSIFILS